MKWWLAISLWFCVAAFHGHMDKCRRQRNHNDRRCSKGTTSSKWSTTVSCALLQLRNWRFCWRWGGSSNSPCDRSILDRFCLCASTCWVPFERLPSFQALQIVAAVFDLKRHSRDKFQYSKGLSLGNCIANICGNRTSQGGFTGAVGKNKIFSIWSLVQFCFWRRYVTDYWSGVSLTVTDSDRQWSSF